MKIEFNVSAVWYSISFNGRNVLELYGSPEDIKQFCDRLELSKTLDSTNASEKMERICVIRDVWTKDEKIFDKFDAFVIENVQDIVTDSFLNIIKNHPDHYWLLCGGDMPDCVQSDNVCQLKFDEDRSHFWNIFVPYEATLYNDLKFSFSDKDYRINMGNKNAILIRGNTCTGKSMMCDALNSLTAYIRSWMDCNGELTGFLVGAEEQRFAKVCVCGLNDLQWINILLKSNSIFEEYKVFVIDHADILVNGAIEKVIAEHPEHNWVLIGNYKPDFISEDAVCVWKNEGNRYWNEFTFTERMGENIKNVF